MRQPAATWRPGRVALLAFALAIVGTSSAIAQPPADDKPTLEIYGFLQGDAIFDFNQNNPDWYDTTRPSKLPKVANEFGQDGHFYLSARQSRFGVKGALPTANGTVTGQFEFDMAGVGRDAGLTTIRLRHAWGQWGKIGAGQTNSQFMDADVFPNTVEYWGPNGMLFLRNPQVFYEIYRDGESNARIAIENPGASGDGGLVADRVEIQNVKPRFPSPDFTGHYRLGGRKWGYVQFGGALRYLGYDDLLPNDQFDLNGHVWGWGIAVSSNVKVGPGDTLRVQLIQGAGIENYFNDAPIDVAVKTNPGSSVTPVVGEALGDFGLSLYFDHSWNDHLTSAVGYSRVDISNSNGQAPNAYKTGQYFSGNLLVTPAKNALMGGEFLWAHRENFSDGFSVSDVRLQFVFKYSFGVKVGG
jgi:outer membrane DcaP-like protein